MKKLDEFTMEDVCGAVADVVSSYVPEVKQEGEFTTPEFIAAVYQQRGIRLSYRQAVYRLDGMVQDGRIEKVIRMDPDSGREITCFRYAVDDCGGE